MSELYIDPRWPFRCGYDYGYSLPRPIWKHGTPAKDVGHPIHESMRPYIKSDYYGQAHISRRRRYVEAMPRKLMCQDCGGAGGWTEYILGEAGGPHYDCDWCGGLGYVTPWERAAWLRYKRAQKNGLDE